MERKNTRITESSLQKTGGLKILLLMIALLFTVFPAVSFAAWTLEEVDAPRTFGGLEQRAIAIDSFNHPHIAYGGDHLYHAYFEGIQWEYEVIDNAPGVGDYASIAIDSNNKVHISYYDYSNGDLKYATNTSGSWVTSTIDSWGNVGDSTSIAVDANNKVHISYYDYSNGDLKYATNASGSWVTSTIDSSALLGHSNSIAIDSNNKVHISYNGYTFSHYDPEGHPVYDGNLKYATNTSGSWVTSTIDNWGDVGYNSSIAIDSNNKVHISYGDDTSYNGNLRYATNAPGSWDISTIDSSGDVGYNSSIAIDSNNKVHISYQDRASGDLKYARNTSGSWVTSTIDSSADSSADASSIAIGSNNKVHIIYHDYLNGNLKYATNTSGSLVIQTVDSPGDVGRYSTSIAIDSNNKVHISYHYWEGATNKGLRYATNASGSWVTSTIDSSGNVGANTSIAIDSNNKVHISYSDANAYDCDLRYATNASGSWVTSTIDSSENAGCSTSIAIDSNNKVHISYSGDGDLKYATNASGSWVTSTIDDSLGNVGQYTSIAIDSNNNVHISYYDSTNGDLKYATNAPGSWDISTIDSSGTVGQYTSIAIDSNNKVHISYYYFIDAFDGNLKYATNAPGSWDISTIDSSGNVGQYTSIAIDSNNKVHISYYDVTLRYDDDGTPYKDGDLKYATNTSGSWVTSMIDDSLGNAGEYTSIAIDSNNNVHISYYNRTNGDLNYATSIPKIYIEPTILSPNSWETIPSGSTYIIRWGASTEAVRFDIGYSLDDGAPGTWKLIASGLTSYSYNWTVLAPDGNKYTCRVGVRGYNASGGVVGIDTSDNPFKIDVVKLTYPNGGVTLTSGGTYQITWQTNGTIRPVQSVQIYGSPDEGHSGTWRLLTTVSGNPGYYDWTVPMVGTTKDKCRLGIRLLDSASIPIGQDVGDGNFTIRPAQ
jgi:hypothetical protein